MLVFGNLSHVSVSAADCRHSCVGEDQKVGFATKPDVT